MAKGIISKEKHIFFLDLHSSIQKKRDKMKNLKSQIVTQEQVESPEYKFWIDEIKEENVILSMLVKAKIAEEVLREYPRRLIPSPNSTCLIFSNAHSTCVEGIVVVFSITNPIKI